MAWMLQSSREFVQARRVATNPFTYAVLYSSIYMHTEDACFLQSFVVCSSSASCLVLSWRLPESLYDPCKCLEGCRKASFALARIASPSIPHLAARIGCVVQRQVWKRCSAGNFYTDISWQASLSPLPCSSIHSYRMLYRVLSSVLLHSPSIRWSAVWVR